MLFRVIIMSFGYGVETDLHMASSAARGVGSREGVGRIKHMEVRCLWVQHMVKRKILKVKPVSTLLNKADLGTKIHTADRLRTLRRLCGIRHANDDDDPEDRALRAVMMCSHSSRTGSIVPGNARGALIALITSLLIGSSESSFIVEPSNGLNTCGGTRDEWDWPLIRITVAAMAVCISVI